MGRSAYVRPGAARMLGASAVWALSETEAALQPPGGPVPLRKLWLRMRSVRHGHQLYLGRHFHLLESGFLTLGERCCIGEFARIRNHTDIEIGPDFLAAPGLHLNSGTHDPITLVAQVDPIRIGARVWCGAEVTILAGVKIGDDVVVGAGSVVCDDLPSNCVAAGVPARVVKELGRPDGQELWSVWPAIRRAGWDADGWAGPRVDLSLATKGSRLVVRGTVPDRPELQGQTLRFRRAGRPQRVLRPSPGPFEIVVPASGRNGDHLHLRIQATRWFVPKEIGMNDDARRLAYVIHDVTWQ